MSRLLRAAAAILAVAVYALPLATSLLTNVVHDAYHLRALIEHGTIEAMVEHEPQPGEFRHAHGGAEHSHGATTDALLSAADRTDEPNEEHHAPTLELVGHLPAVVVIVELLAPEGGVSPPEVAPALQVPPRQPLLPPPRA